MSNLSKILFIVPLLAACAQTDAQPAPTPSAIENSDSAPDLARPQPEQPICGHCGVDTNPGTVVGDDELSMIINTVYKGDIEDVFLVAYTASNTKYNVYFDQSVIDDLNSTQIYETVVFIDTPDMVRGKLVFTLANVTHEVNEPITVDGP